MTWDEILKISCCVVGMFFIPFIIIVSFNKDTIIDFFWKEKIEQVDLNNFSFEARKKASYMNKLIKVYYLCKELDIDRGFYLDLKKKVKDEIDYIQRDLEREVGKVVLKNLDTYKTLYIEEDVK